MLLIYLNRGWLTPCGEVNSLAVEGDPKSDLVFVLVLPISEKTERRIALNIHFRTSPEP